MERGLFFSESRKGLFFSLSAARMSVAEKFLCGSLLYLTGGGSSSAFGVSADTIGSGRPFAYRSTVATIASASASMKRG